ncbi:hypothetical protein [Cohnella zeiphila]|uniref:YgiT-type zinc finger protein n=1 Tax=Cohnella zeiphila TaxID=2761120 RepID=A0A7X0VVU1_9BACL|nr:hypothetical protein [Cohnella zeiphila]MBB6730253.1 hypothetical protein [Cohnella zeiphila]
MFKSCPCGHDMKLILRTVVHARKASIVNVPVYSCEICSRNEVFPGVKEELGRLVGRLGTRPQAQRIPFDEIHEWAAVLREVAAADRPLQAASVMRKAEERTNELLDLMLIASSLGDEIWKKELKRRLSQLSAQYIPT